MLALFDAWSIYFSITTGESAGTETAKVMQLFRDFSFRPFHLNNLSSDHAYLNWDEKNCNGLKIYFIEYEIIIKVECYGKGSWRQFLDHESLHGLFSFNSVIIYWMPCHSKAVWLFLFYGKQKVNSEKCAGCSFLYEHTIKKMVFLNLKKESKYHKSGSYNSCTIFEV